MFTLSCFKLTQSKLGLIFVDSFPANQEISDWMTMKPGTNSPPLFSTRYHSNSIRISETQLRLAEIRDSASRNTPNKTTSTLKRNITLFTSSLIISWIPLIIWRTILYLGVPLSPKICEGGQKISSISPWMRFDI